MAVPQQNDVPNPSSQNRGRRRSGSILSNDYQTQRRHRTRNVRTSSMPGTPLNQQDRTRATIDEKFLADYQTKGIQPQSITDKSSTTPQQPPSATRNEAVEYTNTPQPATPTIQRIAGKKPSPVKKSIYRVRASMVNLGIMSWGIFSWLIFQIPFAILNLVLLGLAGAVDAVAQLVEPDADDGILATIGKGSVRVVGNVISWGAEKLDALTGVDITVLNPTNFFLATYFILFAYGVFMLLIMYFLYKMAMLNPLFGEGASLKFGMFLLAFIGYALPFLNLFPWFLVWAAAVWKHPK